MTTATIQSIHNKAAAMVGQSFMVNTEIHKVANYRIANDNLLICTDRKFFEVDLQNADKLISVFLPVSEEPGQTQELTVKSLSVTADIRDIIMGNIHKLKDSSEYIPQAQAINESVKVLVDVAKTEILMLDLLHKIRP